MVTQAERWNNRRKIGSKFLQWVRETTGHERTRLGKALLFTDCDTHLNTKNAVPSAAQAPMANRSDASTVPPAEIDVLVRIAAPLSGQLLADEPVEEERRVLLLAVLDDWVIAAGQ